MAPFLLLVRFFFTVGILLLAGLPEGVPDGWMDASDSAEESLVVGCDSLLSVVRLEFGSVVEGDLSSASFPHQSQFQPPVLDVSEVASSGLKKKKTCFDFHY